MKHVFLFGAAGLLSLAACNTAPDADKVSTAEAQTAAAANGDALSVDVAGSTVAWIGTKATGQHNGTFQISSGTLTVDNGNLTGGNFTIDLNSLAVLDLEGDDRGQLEGHLKSADFFNVENHPTAQFEITSVVPFDAGQMESKLAGATHLISGNLTMNGVTKNISFPAVVRLEGNTLTAQADFNIDRTEWNMNYKGPNNPQDWFIAKEVNLKLDVKAGGMQ